jgi:putative tricarboxylic transport membrane protein
VATLKEQGVDATYTNWRSVIGPKTLGRDQLAYWEKALAAAVVTDEWRQDLERNFWTANFLTGEPARRYVEQQAELFGTVLRELGMGKK